MIVSVTGNTRPILPIKDRFIPDVVDQLADRLASE